MKDDSIYTERYKGHTIKIYQDPCPENPREAWDNFGTMICFHSRYCLGDKHTWEKDAFLEYIKGKNIIALPIFLYDHSGITMNTKGFSCHWDSGQVGYIFVTKEEIRKSFNCQVITAKIRQQAIDCLEADVSVYDQYLAGNVYGYSIEETGDACWGFYGDYESCCLEEARSVVDWQIKHDIKKHIEQVKAWIRNRVPLIYRKECFVKE